MEKTAISPVTTRKQGPKIRVPSMDFAVAEDVLKSAADFIIPDDQTQKKAFEKLMPHLYVLRNKGCSFQQLTQLLTQCGFKLQPSTVRDYFREGLAKRMDVCQERLNEQMALLKEVRKRTEGAQLTEIADRVIADAKQRRALSAAKMDAIFGAQGNPAPAPDQNAGRSPAPVKSAPVVPVEFVEPVPASNEASESGPLSHASGMAENQAIPAVVSSDAAHTDTADSSSAVRSEKKSAATPRAGKSKNTESPKPALAGSSDGPKLRCLPLVDGLTPIKRVDGVPDIVHQRGDLEHPAIPGLMLTLGQRLSPVHLEYANADGEIMSETPVERRFRVMWKKPIPMTISKTDSSFTDIDPDLFRK